MGVSRLEIRSGFEEEIDQVRKEKEAAIEAQEFEKAANLRDKERRLTNKKRELEEQWKSDEGGPRASIGEEEIVNLDEDDELAAVPTRSDDQG